MANSEFALNSCALELQNTWMQFEKTKLLDIRLDGSHRTVELDRYKMAQIDHSESVRATLRKKWYHSVLQTFLDPPHDPFLNRLIQERKSLFKSMSVLITRQLRGLVESTCSDLAEFFECFKPIDDKLISIAAKGKNDVKVMPALSVKLVVTGSHIRVVPSLEEMDSTMRTILDHAVGACEGFPVMDPSLFPSYSPFSDDYKHDDKEEITSERLSNDQAGIAAQLFDAVDSGNCLRVARTEEESIETTKQRIYDVLVANMEGPRKIVEMYEKYVHDVNNLLHLDSSRFGSEYKALKKPLEQYKTDIEMFRKAADDATDVTARDIYMGLFVVQTETVKRGIAAKALQMAEVLLTQVLSQNMDEMNEVCTRFDQMNSRAMEKPKESHEMKGLKAYLESAPKEQGALHLKILNIHKRMSFLHSLGKEIPDEDMLINTKVYMWPDKIQPVLDQAMERILTQEEKMEEALKSRQRKFADDVKNSTDVFASLDEMGEPRLVANYLQQVTKLKKDLEDLAVELDAINQQEDIFGWNPTVNSQVAENLIKLEPYEFLFKSVHESARDIHNWLHGPVLDLNAEKVENEIDNAWRTAYKFQKTWADNPNAMKLTMSMKESVGNFKKNVPLVTVMCNPGLRDRHWDSFAGVVGMPIKPSDRTSLQDIVDKKLDSYLGKMEEISESASKEYSLEKNLDKQLSEWTEAEFQLTPYRDTGTSILSGACVDEIQTILDDQIVKTQTMLASPYIKAFEQRANDWNQFLQVTQDILDYWIKVQSQWLYLEPIFASEDIKKQMPKEAERFVKVDGMVRSAVSKCLENTKVLVFSKTEGLIESLKESFELLELINKGLNAYLEEKRLYFSRFFFLSNDELLSILAETKDPLRVQPHLKKCFEAIDKLQFNDQLIVEGMISSEKELVPWPRKLNPAEARGAVEKWLLQTEALMKESVRDQTAKARLAYPQTARKQWCIEWPGMVVICIGQMYWTSEVEAAIVEPGGKGVHRYAEKCTEQLNDIIDLVRGQLTKLQRQAVGALCVLDVHARDMTVALAEEGVKTPLDFSWLAQMRYVWEEENVSCKMITAMLKYGYEYLGVSSRLVVTPLTDRCYRTLMGALQLYLGGAPEGPAGTGKTETTKDLAKAVSNYCVVFNCSDGLDYLQMGKFFKGVASCGAWACFDEFNRIDLEVLSVVAQQIMHIQRSVQLGKTEFEFEGSHLQLIRSCAVFITMNPGYAGRAELPDNLKVLFRTVAMMVPDYAMIGEIMLMSFGFSDARNLAKKIVATYKLCSEQLSSQTHYDYGMRAVMAVLRAAGNLKQAYLDQHESVLMLRSIRDVNLPKFLSHDLPLFEGIAKDLFPGVELPQPDYVNMLGAMNWACEQANLQPGKYFLQKTMELYEMIVVRHGLMVVGLSYGAKTCSYRVLQATLGKLKELDQNEENQVKVFAMNPKSITMGQLYGQSDPVSNEWTDGILAILFRTAASDPSPDRKWVMFDGPVDAIWIENMNTVLDDNKKLCLVSGEIIQMSSTMNMIFEPQDLEVASPATVSRCGMVYYEPHQMGLYPSLFSWLNTLPPLISKSDKSMIESMFKWLVPPALKFLRKELKEVSPTSDIHMAWSLMKLIDSMLIDFKYGEGYEQELKYYKLTEKEATAQVEGIFLFSMAWSICASVDSAGREKFSDFIKECTAGTVPSPYHEEGERGKYIIGNQFPKEGNIYQYQFDTSKNKWVLWTSLISREPFPNTMEPHEIIVPTIDTTRYTFWLDKCCKNATLNHTLNKMAFLLVGPTGTGKTVYINNHLLSGLSPEKFSIISLGFSAQTTAGQTQDIIDSKLDKRKKGVYGPPVGRKCLVFVDDLNMPTKETYGAQPPIEILRQYMDFDGWYDNKEKVFRGIIDMMYVCAMGPPGGGRTFITPRFTRWFNVISVTEFDGEAMTGIFDSIMKFQYEKKGTPGVIKNLKDNMIKSTLEVYDAALSNLLPTPLKSHYLFNLRDFARVVFGVLMADTESMTDGAQGVRLWIHEILRVFYDRLTDDNDRSWLIDLIRATLKKNFSFDLSKIMEHLLTPEDGGVVEIPQIRRLLFGDFGNPEGKRVYTEMREPQKVIEVTNTFLEDHNAMSKKPMQLVLFLFMIEHISRICRVLRSPGGHALLVGVGGSGRQSCTRLASFIMDFIVIEIEISKVYGKNEWREDLKRLLTSAGGDGKSATFLFTDTQIKLESFVEDINNLLNTAEVPNLFASDEKATLGEKVRPAAKALGRPLNTPAEAWAFFIERCKTNLHIVLAFSPVSDTFRARLRQFPSLVNCCTIDWFTTWPEDALLSVATRFLAEVEMTSDAVRSSCVEMCILMQVSARNLTDKFWNETRRKNYVTPTSYLELINTYKSLLGTKRDEVQNLIKRYRGGLGALSLAEESVNSMKQELMNLQPGLAKAAEETGLLTEQVEAKVPEVEAQKAVAAKDEAITAGQAADVKQVKDECEADLAEAIPIVNEALKALDTIKKQDIDLVKSMGKPPAGVMLAMQAVQVMLQMKPDKKNDPDTPGKKIDDWWAPAVRLLNTGTLLTTLKEYDKDNIDPKVIEKIRKDFKTNEAFTPAQIAKASSAAEGLCKWVLAMESYDRVAKIVAPKKVKLAQAEDELAEAMRILGGKRAALKVIVDELDGLLSQLEGCKIKSKDLQDQADLCTLKLERAEQLITGLGGEKSRWTSVAESLEHQKTNLTGDVLVASGYVAYLGAFMRPYRDEVIGQWVQTLAERAIPRSDKFSLQSVLGDPVRIREWIIAGLPADSFSVDNGIVVSQARRWPLCIDPQGQANKYFRNMEKKNKMKVIKLTDGDFVRTLENSIQFGTPVLLENVQEELDPTIEPLLLKQTFKQGGMLCMRLGDATIEYSKDFRFYITTKLPNPHYMPETSVKVTLLNFMITQDGLQDQLLGIVVAQERPDLEEEKNALILEGAENKRRLKETEDKILEVLSADGNILENQEGIQVLKDAKILSNEIEEKQVIADATEKRIDEARAGYTDIAWRMSINFFVISSLGNIEPMYQYSLSWFINLFIQAIRESEPASELDQRLKNLFQYATYFLYKMVCRSLFEKDKLIFSFLLCTRMMRAENILSEDELKFLLTGGIAVGDPEPNPHQAWLVDKSWGEIGRMSKLEQAHGFKEDFETLKEEWKTVFQSAEPFNMAFPGRWNDCTSFTRLMIMRCLRPDKLVPTTMLFVVKEMGQKFIEPPPLDLEACYQDSNPCAPLIFILSAGSDPNASLFKLAVEKGFGETMKTVSLGQGQGPRAAQYVAEAYNEGGWVVLQNCHVYGSWMTSLERICEEFKPETAHKNFRLWLTSYPSPVFPVSVLQNGIKMTNEPAKGIRMNVKGSFLADPLANEDFFADCKKPKKWKKLCYALCFFHALMQERRSFGPLGWNIPYEFTMGDMTISLRQTQMMLNEYEADQFQALNYLIGECNYGGRVTDDKDRRFLCCALSDFYNPLVYEDGYIFSPSGVYRAPDGDANMEAILEHIMAMPLTQAPEVFGLHANADITKDQQDTNYFCDTVLSTEAGGGGGGGAGAGAEDALDNLAQDILNRTPVEFDRERVMKRYPIKFEESMNTVLAQELIRYNALISTVRSSLINLRKALKGLIVMSADLEEVQTALVTNKVPGVWMKKSYPSLKPLGSYVSDFHARLAFFHKWIDSKMPPMFWLSGFFFVHAFMTGGLQNYARKYTIPVDTLSFEHIMMEEEKYDQPAEEGILVYGPFCEACRWNPETRLLEESEAKVLFSSMPIMHFMPRVKTALACEYKPEKRDAAGHRVAEGFYVAPLYNTAARRGVLATTGHSSNFVCPIVIPSGKTQSHWIKRGAALLMQLSD
jgi:dynein heavy chain